MEHLWHLDGSEVSVRDVADALPECAYTTVATVLDRLVQKGILRCRLVARTKRYIAVGSRGAHTAVLMREALSADADPTAALRRFAASLTPSEIRVMRQALRQTTTRRIQ